PALDPHAGVVPSAGRTRPWARSSASGRPLLASYFLRQGATITSMTRHDPTSVPAWGSDPGREARHRLDVAFATAAVDADDLDAAGRLLLARLSRRSDDFAATAALQALNAFFVGQRTDNPSPAPAHLRDAGLSSLQRRRA